MLVAVTFVMAAVVEMFAPARFNATVVNHRRRRRDDHRARHSEIDEHIDAGEGGRRGDRTASQRKCCEGFFMMTSVWKFVEHST